MITHAVWSAGECRADDDCDWRRHEQGRHSRRVTTVSGWLQLSFAVWSACGSSSHFPGSKLVHVICLVVVSVLSRMILLSVFFSQFGKSIFSCLCVGMRFPLGFYICALVYKNFARISKNPRTTTRGRLLCTPTSFLFSCFYMLSFALSDVCREHLWPWWQAA